MNALILTLEVLVFSKDNWIILEAVYEITYYYVLQQDPTGCNIYFQFISIINLYLFLACSSSGGTTLYTVE
jgi:hypothetical protein